jgi:hypothetical protein
MVSVASNSAGTGPLRSYRLAMAADAEIPSPSSVPFFLTVCGLLMLCWVTLVVAVAWRGDGDRSGAPTRDPDWVTPDVRHLRRLRRRLVVLSSRGRRPGRALLDAYDQSIVDMSARAGLPLVDPTSWPAADRPFVRLQLEAALENAGLRLDHRVR